ncbi:protein FAR1-RELATED SEQUENCE 5-like [Arachis ipaensis]|uniref:protein FAR1-RELATED SEQUENCE 5-like n=1 Tax=Arachis ipaensis TaxID=130454 RepID=UPI0007AF30F4|nr:protein FAR1-RELATED SEQUENCE 5-like [Arachis ipaensis]XP_025670666.1 protein FAR1-RELATED SEQUENCE 5-like [Arachis hypogaea]
MENPRCPNLILSSHPWRLGGRPHRSSFVLFVYVLKVTVAFNFWIPDNVGGWNRSKRSSRRPCLSYPPDRTSWHHRSQLVLVTGGGHRAILFVDAVVPSPCVIMASSSKFCKDACMWNEPLADNWMEGKGGVSNSQDTMYDTRVEEDAELSDWEGRGASMLPVFLGLDGLQAEDVLEMEFSSPQEASGFYNNYSRLKRFASRRGKTVRNTAGEIVWYTFVCNRQGFREKKWLEKVDRKREHKVVTRCGCMAEMRIKRKEGSGRWYVSRFVEEHNHELAYGKLVDYLRSHRKISEVEVAQLTSMREIGISIPKIYESFAAQLGGFNLVTFTKQDMYNEIRKQRGLQGGDVSAAIRYLEGLARMDGKMFWRYKLGAGQHLCNLFWSDSRCQEDYGIFGDVLAFDATYGRNKYNLPVVVFSGVNHHNQTCVFGTAMVSCESQESYIWVLRQFLECMQGKAPHSVITDGDPAMRIAIRSVFPEAHHRLCAWHLLRNATVNISDPRFTQMFRHCMLADMEIEEFEAHWESMLNECGVREVEWVKELYSKKHAWATAYIRGRFFAGVRTTSRCESLHAKLGRFVESRYGVLEFVRNFQRCVDFLRDTEDELDFRSWYGTPVLQTEFVELEKSGWTVFTREMFVRFRDSLKRCVRVRICEFNDSENPHTYTLQKYRRPEMNWKVYRDHISNRFSCSCMRMESFGIPCVHILSVCVMLDLVEIPESLVLRRWSKAAKLEIHNQCVEQQTADPSVTYRTRLGAFSQLCKRLGRVACMSDEDFKLYSKKLLSDALFLEIKYGLRPSTDDITTANDCGVKDPIRVRTKGTGRMSQAGGSAPKTKRKCSTCGKLGHRRTRCPNGAAQASTRINESHGGRNKRKRSKVCGLTFLLMQQVPVVVRDNCQPENACQAGSDKWEHFSLADP